MRGTRAVVFVQPVVLSASVPELRTGEAPHPESSVVDGEGFPAVIHARELSSNSGVFLTPAEPPVLTAANGSCSHPVALSRMPEWTLARTP